MKKERERQGEKKEVTEWANHTSSSTGCHATRVGGVWHTHQ